MHLDPQSSLMVKCMNTTTTNFAAGQEAWEKKRQSHMQSLRSQVCIVCFLLPDSLAPFPMQRLFPSRRKWGASATACLPSAPSGQS